MSGKGSGRRGRGGRGGAKRSRDDFERKITSNSESAEPAAPLPGGFKSMKAKWISFYENEQKAQESAPSVRPQSAADTAEDKHTAAESKPHSSAPHSVPEIWRKQNPPEAVRVPDREDIGSSSKHQSRRAEPVTEERANSMQPPDPSAVLAVAIPRPKVEDQSTAALPTSAAAAQPEPPNSTSEGVVQAGDKAEQRYKEEAAVIQQPSPAQVPAGSSGPVLRAEQPAAAETASASGLGPGRVAAIQDAAASYKAASKAHSSMQEALSPKRAEASGRPSAPKGIAVELNSATAVEAKTAALHPSMPSEDAAAPPHSLQQGQPVAVEQHVHANEGQQSMAVQGKHPVLDGPAVHGATPGKLREDAEGGSSQVNKRHQPKPEIKREDEDLTIPSATRDPIANEQKKPRAKDRAVLALQSSSGLRQPKQKGQKKSAERQQGPGTGTQHSAGPALKQSAQSGLGPDGRRAGQPGLSGQKAGQQASLKARTDPTSRQEIKKALAQAKAAADGRVAQAQDDVRAEEHNAGWRAQVQDTEIANNEGPVPIELATGPAHVAEEASRQKGSDASSLERSPDIPHADQQPQHQQQRADDAKAQGVEDQEQDALANSTAATAISQPLQLAPVEYMGEGSCASQQLGQIDLKQFDSYRALWDGLREDYGQWLPEGLHLRLVYEDGEGDFVMLQPDEPWPAFLSSARRVIISCQ